MWGKLYSTWLSSLQLKENKKKSQNKKKCKKQKQFMVNLYLCFISSHFNNQNTEEEKFYPAECRQAAICLLGWKSPRMI